MASKTLILMRHAKSSWQTPGPDFRRPLNERGVADATAAGPILADYYVVRKREYSTGAPDDLPNVRLPGIISFLVGAVLGIVFQYFLPLPFDFPAGVGALIVTFALHIALSKALINRPEQAIVETPGYHAQMEAEVTV